MGTLGGASDSADFCRTLFESMREGCIHCRLIYERDEPVDWIFLDVNPGFEALTGLRDLAGRRISDLVPGFRESSQDTLATFGRVAAGGCPEPLATLGKPLEGWGPAEVMSPGPGRIIAKFGPQADQRAGVDSLPHQDSLIRTILDHLPLGIAVNQSDPVHHPTYMNDLFPRFYRTTREALGDAAATPDTFWECAFEDPVARESIKARVLEDLGSGDPARMHWERIPITRKGEDTAFVDARNIPVPGTTTMISTVWDVTETVRREERARRTEAQLNQVQKMESLGLLAGGVAHDINNVLGSILAVATIHRRKAPDGTPLRRDMETIEKACLRGGSLAKSLLGFARKDLSGARLLNLNDLIRDEVRLLEATTPPNIRVSLDLSEDLPDLQGDPTALRHAIMSLCTNAIEAMPEGGTLQIRTRNDGSAAVLVEFEDSGTGMAPEALQQAVTPFYTTKQSSRGMGLGLSIVHGTVRSHQGALDLLSEPGRGTLVRLRFPTPGSLQAEESATETAGDKTPTAGKTILFVDDDPLLVQSMPRWLESLGHSATTAAGGEQALALLDQGFRPDLVILDLNMPGMGGLETFLQLRKRTPTLPVLLSTGFSSQHLQEVVQQHPAVSLLQKPYTLDALHRQILAVSP